MKVCTLDSSIPGVKVTVLAERMTPKIPGFDEDLCAWVDVRYRWRDHP